MKQSLRTALLSQPWPGFLTAAEIADRLERWSVATVSERLRQLAREGLLWSIVEAGATPTLKFAHVRIDTADIVVPAGHRSLQRSWKPVRRIAA